MDLGDVDGMGTLLFASETDVLGFATANFRRSVDLTSLFNLTAEESELSNVDTRTCETQVGRCPVSVCPPLDPPFPANSYELFLAARGRAGHAPSRVSSHTSRRKNGKIQSGRSVLFLKLEPKARAGCGQVSCDEEERQTEGSDIAVNGFVNQ